MPGERPKIHGMHAVTGWLLEYLLDRPDGHSRKLPVVVALGPRGTGKTALLRDIEYRCAHVPHAYLDFESREREPREVFGELAFELSKHRKQFGRIAFPRLWLCLLAVGSTLHTRADNRRQALRELRRIVSNGQGIEQGRNGIMDFVQLVDPIGAGLPAWTAPVADGLLRGLGWFDRRRLLAAGPRLPSAQGRLDDVLIDLARWAHDDDEDRADVDAIFCEAFLHDLRRAYSGFNRSRRTLNCVVLLDNVHTMSGQKFLLALQEARRRATGEPDPMAVFASSGNWIPYWSESWHRPGGHRFSDDEGRRPRGHRTGGIRWPAPRKASDIDADWLDNTGTETPWNPWYLLDLSHLSTQDIGDLAVERRMHSIPRVTEFVRGLTAGHPGGTVEILAALSRACDNTPLAGAHHILHAALPEAESQEQQDQLTVLDRVRAELLRDFDTAADRRDLVTASAARTVDMLYRPEVLDSPLPNGEGLLEALRNQLWIEETDGAEPELVLNPWLRHILLQELADRDDSDPRDWDTTHILCRNIYENSGREAAARYHDMAIGDLGAVISYLGQPFADRHTELDVATAGAWLADVDLITSAPIRSSTDIAPIDRVGELVRACGAAPDHPVAWLVASLWISNNPLGDPERSLDHTIESELRQLARGRGRGSVLLYERAERYR